MLDIEQHIAEVLRNTALSGEMTCTDLPKLAIVLAAALHPVIETVEQLDTLPVGSIILEIEDSEAWPYQSYRDQCTGDTRWTWEEMYPGDSDPQSSLPLPARLIWSPEWSSK